MLFVTKITDTVGFIFYVAFNWKERKQLRIQRKFDLKKLGVFSSFNIDEDDFDDEEEGADEVIDLTATDFFEEDRTFGGVDNTRKVLHPPLLFGSHKNAGILPRKEKTGPKHFRYARYLERKQAGNASWTG